MFLTACALAALSVPAAVPAAAPAIDDGHGKLDWFEGTFEELLAESAKSEKIIFLDFWTDWCGWCKKLDQTTFSDDRVVEEMGDVLCYSVDAESESGRPIAERFRVQGFPTLLLLDPDGSPRDNIGGYLNPEQFIKEIRRVRRDEGTVGALERAVAENPEDASLRADLIERLLSFGDLAGAEEQIAAIRKIDPEGEEVPWRRLRFQIAADRLQRSYDGESMRALVADETDPDVLTDGWFLLLLLDNYHAQSIQADEELPDDLRESKLTAHLNGAEKAARELWRHCPEKRRVEIGGQVAWLFYQLRDMYREPQLRFAQQVAEEVSALAPANADALDTLACLQFANGEKEKAMETIGRAIELEPGEPSWQRRRAEFEAAQSG